MGVMLLVGTMKGLFRFRSDERRSEWSMEPVTLPWIPIHAALYDGRDGRIVVAANNPFFGAAIRRSDDLGATWDEGTLPAYGADDAERVTRVWEIAAAPDGTLLAGTEASGLFRSRDGGETWEEIASLRRHPTHEVWRPGAGGKCLHTIAADPADPDRLYVACSTGGLYRSDDGGGSWRPVNQGIQVNFVPEGERYPEAGQCVHAFCLTPARPGRIWLQNHGGVYRSDDGGASWLDVGGGLPSDFGFPILAHPRAADTAYVVPLATNATWFVDKRAAVYRTDDGGGSWRPLTAGLPAPSHADVLRHGLVSDGLDPLGIYLGTTSGGLYASADEGETWRELASDLPRIQRVVAVPLPA